MGLRLNYETYSFNIALCNRILGAVAQYAINIKPGTTGLRTQVSRLGVKPAICIDHMFTKRKGLINLATMAARQIDLSCYERGQFHSTA